MTLAEIIKKRLKDLLNLFIQSFQPPLGAAVGVMVEEPKQVGRPIKKDALRRNTKYQSMMKKRRRLEQKAKRTKVKQSEEVEYVKLCREIDAIRKQHGGS